jgi:hypothetical protein
VTPPWIEPLTKMTDRLAASLALGSAWIKASEADCLAVGMGWNYGVQWEYPSPWRLACTKGERGTPYDRIVATMVLAALDRHGDSREELILYSLAYNACLLAHLDGDAVLATVSAKLPGPAAASLCAFLARVPEDKALSAFGLTTVLSADAETEIRPMR